MDVLTNFPLQPLVDKHDCKYFAENATGECETLNLALRSPFAKLFVLNRDGLTVDAHRQRFRHNDRVHVFRWTHSGSWSEVIRLIPFEEPAVFWMHADENIQRCVTSIARLRPHRRDILITEPSMQRGVFGSIDRYFGRTHQLYPTNTPMFVYVPRGKG